MKARKRTKVVVYQRQEIEKLCQVIVVHTRNDLYSYFKSSPQPLERQKRIIFFSKPHDATSTNQGLMRHIWTHCPDVNLPVFPDDEVDSFVDNLVWPFALKYASGLRPIMKPFLEVQTYLISEAEDDENLEHLEEFSSSLQPSSPWLLANCMMNRFGVVCEKDGVCPYKEVFDSSPVENWCNPTFRTDRILFCKSLEVCPIIADGRPPNGTNLPWFFNLGVTWGEFRDRCQQSANVAVKVEELCSFIHNIRMSWIPLFDPNRPRSTPNPIVSLPVPKESFVFTVPPPAQAKDKAGEGTPEGEVEEEGEGEREEEGQREEVGAGTVADEVEKREIQGEATEGAENEGGGDAAQSVDRKGDAGIEVAGSEGDSYAAQSAERKEDGSESGAPFSVMVGNSIMAEKASDGAKIEHRLANVFPKTAAGDSVVHAHAPL